MQWRVSYLDGLTFPVCLFVLGLVILVIDLYFYYLGGFGRTLPNTLQIHYTYCPKKHRCSIPKIYFTGKYLSEALIFAEHGENMLSKEIVLNVKTISVHNMEFSCIELVIQ